MLSYEYCTSIDFYVEWLFTYNSMNINSTWYRYSSTYEKIKLLHFEYVHTVPGVIGMVGTCKPIETVRPGEVRQLLLIVSLSCD